MLEGFDEDWNLTSSGRRMVSYSNLNPGNYTFRVKASNNDGKWGNNEKTLHIKILPPFYITIWFKAILSLFLASLIYLIYSYRLNIHKNQFRQTQIEQERRIMHLEKEQLESELQKLTFHVLNRNRALIDQKNRLIGLSMKAREVVRIGLQDIITKIDEELTDDKDWMHIEPQLDKVYNNFVTRLKEKHPDLTLSEIKIAAYIRMNMSTKEISEFMHKTTRAVENDRYRLRKKIGLDMNDSLQNYLINL
jgi:DNA-binding CsgD family transcriptional regulator